MTTLILSTDSASQSQIEDATFIQATKLRETLLTALEDHASSDIIIESGINVYSSARIDRKGKLPDVVLYWPERNWLLLIESVTSHGPVDGKRHSELSKLFKDSKPGLVYVTAFPDRKIMGKYLGEISWETEVWMSEAPTHMIHFNGDRFLGPHD